MGTASLQKQWTVWQSIHQTADQEKRLASAKKSACTPLSVDKNNGTGEFSGSHGKYHSTLSECNCVDFARRKKPCKHMYRLALELGLMEGDVSHGIPKQPKPDNAYHLTEAVDKLETLSSEAQKLLQDYLSATCNQTEKQCLFPKNSAVKELLEAEFLLEVITSDTLTLLSHYTRDELFERASSYAPDVAFKKKITKASLIKWITENVDDPIKAICYDTISVILSPRLYGIQKEVHTYLRYIYGTETYYDPDLDEFVTVPLGKSESSTITIDSSGVTTKLSESNSADDVEELLKKYHHLQNR